MGVTQNETQGTQQISESSSRAAGIGHTLVSTIPIFIILLGLLVSVSGLTLMPWKKDPTNQRVKTLSQNTAVTFDNPNGVHLAKLGEYAVQSRHVTLDIKRPSTGEVQHIRVNIREPKGLAEGGASTDANAPGRAFGAHTLPAMVFMHGAGYGTCDNSFGDVAQDFSSVGFVTAVLDKPVWSTNDITRDYPGSAVAYDQVVNYLRGLPSVDSNKVGLYATSESTWISPYVIKRDKHIAFQILLSPMVYVPRHAVGFFVAQDFALVGANPGYQSIVRRLFHIDSAMFGLNNLDVPVDLPEAYSVPTLALYGSKDVMTAQVEGMQRIFDSAHSAGNTNVTVRSYSTANHVLRLGDEADLGTPLVDEYEHDATDWVVGTVAGLKQSSEPVAGTEVKQSIAVPTELSPNRPLTVYGTVLHALMVVALLLALVFSMVALVMKIVRLLRHDTRSVLGLRNGFGRELLAISVTTLAALVLLGSGLGQVIMAMVKLIWGSAPDEDPGVMNWSWPVIQVAATFMVWAWALVVARLVDLRKSRTSIRLPKRKRCNGQDQNSELNAGSSLQSSTQPVLAATRFGRVFFWVVAISMFLVLLFFAFWGVFIY